MADQEDKIAAAANARKEAEAYDKKVRDAFDDVARTEAGQILFGYLMHKCLFHESTLAMDSTGKVNTDAMIHNEARRRLYIKDIRLLIPENIRRRIEN